MNDPTHLMNKKLKGFAVGDGCLGKDNLCGNNGPGPLYDIAFFCGHNQVSMKTCEAINKTCTLAELTGYGVNVTTPAC